VIHIEIHAFFINKHQLFLPLPYYLFIRIFVIMSMIKRLCLNTLLAFKYMYINGNDAEGSSPRYGEVRR